MGRPLRLGCMNGCDPYYHEDPCPKAQPQYTQPAATSSYERGYSDGYDAGYKAAEREFEIRQRAQQRAREEAAMPRQTIRVERLDTPKELS